MCQPFPKMSSILRVWTEETAAARCAIDNAGNHNSAGFLHKSVHSRSTGITLTLSHSHPHLLAPKSSHSHLPISNVLWLHSGEDERERICWENTFTPYWLAAAQALLLMLFADSMSADPFLVHHTTPRRICKLTCVPSTPKIRLHLSNWQSWSPISCIFTINTSTEKLTYLSWWHFKMLSKTQIITTLNPSGGLTTSQFPVFTLYLQVK